MLRRLPLVLLLLSLGLVACEGGGKWEDDCETTSAGVIECAPDKRPAAPDVSGELLEGGSYNLTQDRGKVVVINFWATWCGPCKKELPDLSKLYLKFKDKGVVMLGVLTNDNPSEGDLLNFQSDAMMEFPVVRQTSDILVSFNYPQALPTTFIYDRAGRRVGNPRVGAVKFEDMEATLTQLTTP